MTIHERIARAMAEADCTYRGNTYNVNHWIMAEVVIKMMEAEIRC